MQLVNYTAVDDVGTVIDPMIVEGQLNPPAGPSMPRPVTGRSVPAPSAPLWLAVRNKYLAQINKSRRGTISRAANGKTRYGSALLVFRFGGAELWEDQDANHRSNDHCRAGRRMLRLGVYARTKSRGRD